MSRPKFQLVPPRRVHRILRRRPLRGAVARILGHDDVALELPRHRLRLLRRASQVRGVPVRVYDGAPRSALVLRVSAQSFKKKFQRLIGTLGTVSFSIQTFFFE